MTHLDIHTRQGWPSDVETLLAEYPREAWPDHPHFAQSIQNWMGAHRGFRQLGELIRLDTEAYLGKARAPEDFGARLGYFGNLMVRNLHGHHTWEDRRFFPEIQAIDDRFETGLETLESDHEVLDEVLERITGQANRAIKLIQLDEAQAREEAKTLRDTAEEIEGFLARHLEDEEDLIVPIVLHHKMRG